MSEDGVIHLDALIVGAGFGGLNALLKFRKAGYTVLAVEAGEDVGGVWYWNRYPGARCDVESLAYAYSFLREVDEEWRWSERYSAQPEIQSYLRFVSERFDLRRDIRFGVRVVSAHFIARTGRWLIEADDGTRYDARFCIMATGPLTVPQNPDIPGVEDFAGEAYHTGVWPEDVVFEGKRVGVIGQGSSAVQLIPVVAKTAAELAVFVRTPNYVVPAFNGELTADHYDAWSTRCDTIRQDIRGSLRGGSGDVFVSSEELAPTFRSGHDYAPAERDQILETYWQLGGAMMMRAFSDVMIDDAINAYVSEFVRKKARKILTDPAKAEVLVPRIPIGGKRICIGTDYYEAYNRDNVHAIDVAADPIVRIEPKGVALASGRRFELDLLVYATGFDALTGALTRIDVRGVDGCSLTERWADGAECYLGLMVAGFPNMFVIGGPGSPSVLSNVVSTNEVLIEFLLNLTDFMDRKGMNVVDADATAQAEWVDEVDRVGKDTVFARVKNWYNGSNVPGKPPRFLPWAGGIGAYRERLRAIAANGYAGFALSRSPQVRVLEPGGS